MTANTNNEQNNMKNKFEAIKNSELSPQDKLSALTAILGFESVDLMIIALKDKLIASGLYEDLRGELKEGDTVEIKGLSYTIEKVLRTGRKTVVYGALGVIFQGIAKGKKGALYLLQVFESGAMRLISDRGGRPINS